MQITVPKRIILDPGHGGVDPGAVGTFKGEKVPEKFKVWELAYLVRKAFCLYYNDIECIVIQPSDYEPDIDSDTELNQVINTVNLLNGSLLVSFHLNAGGGTGFESYIHPSASAETVRMRNTFHESLKRYMTSYNLPDRGKKIANFAILRQTLIPSILLECAFLDSKDIELIMNDDFLVHMARGIMFSIAKSVGVYY